MAETPDRAAPAAAPSRLVQKQRAGAGIAVLNHVASAARRRVYAPRAIAAGLTIPVVASVAVYTDARSAAVLAALPGLKIDPAAVRRCSTRPDPVAAGIAAAVGEARRLLAVEGIVGVNLSGMASARGIYLRRRGQGRTGHGRSDRSTGMPS